LIVVVAVQRYDLLDPNHETKKLEDLPKVSM
jgi:hypothetical protein